MYAWTQKYVGIPFLSGGRNEGGVDCYGLVRLILNNEYGYNLPLLSNTYDNALDISDGIFISKIRAAFMWRKNIEAGRKSCRIA